MVTSVDNKLNNNLRFLSISDKFASRLMFYRFKLQVSMSASKLQCSRLSLILAASTNFLSLIICSIVIREQNGAWTCRMKNQNGVALRSNDEHERKSWASIQCTRWMHCLAATPTKATVLDQYINPPLLIYCPVGDRVAGFCSAQNELGRRAPLWAERRSHGMLESFFFR